MKTAAIEVPVLETKKIELTVQGVTPLICHNWSQDNKDKILSRQQGTARNKTARNPVREFLDSLYWMDCSGHGMPHDVNEADALALVEKSTFGFPAQALKSAMVAACTHVDTITKVFARSAFHIDTAEPLLEIQGTKPEMHEATVRIGMDSGELRYRGIFKEWSITVPILITGRISISAVANLLKIAGQCNGIGDWRPECNGLYGRFEVK